HDIVERRFGHSRLERPIDIPDVVGVPRVSAYVKVRVGEISDRLPAVKHEVVSRRGRQALRQFLGHQIRNARNRSGFALSGGSMTHMDVHRPPPMLLCTGTGHFNILQLNADARWYLADRQRSVRRFTLPIIIPDPAGLAVERFSGPNLRSNGDTIQSQRRVPLGARDGILKTRSAALRGSRSREAVSGRRKLVAA